MSRALPIAPVRALALACLPVILVGCGGGGGDGPTDPTETRLIVVGVARNDISPENQLEGLVAFFFDRDRQELLHARASVNGRALNDSLLPGTVPGPIYGATPGIIGGREYSLTATVFAPEGEILVTSEAVVAPEEFEPILPDVHAIGQPLVVAWPDLPDAERVNVAIPTLAFEADANASAGTFTIPATVFAGVEPGSEIEVEVTAYNVFYVSIAAGISGIQDAEEFAARFRDVDNVEGAVGAFGAAVSTGGMVTFQ